MREAAALSAHTTCYVKQGDVAVKLYDTDVGVILKREHAVVAMYWEANVGQKVKVLSCGETERGGDNITQCRE